MLDVEENHRDDRHRAFSDEFLVVDGSVFVEGLLYLRDLLPPIGRESDHGLSHSPVLHIKARSRGEARGACGERRRSARGKAQGVWTAGDAGRCSRDMGDAGGSPLTPRAAYAARRVNPRVPAAYPKIPTAQQ